MYSPVRCSCKNLIKNPADDDDDDDDDDDTIFFLNPLNPNIVISI